MRILTYLIFFMTMSVSVFGQGNISTVTSNKLHSRTVVSPYFFPYLPLQGKLSNREGIDVPVLENNGYQLGISWLRYSPNGKLDKHLNMGLANRQFTFLSEAPTNVRTNALIIAPGVDLHHKKIGVPTHPYLSVGLNSHFVIRKEIQQFSSPAFFNPLPSDVLAGLRTWLSLGIGVKRDIFLPSVTRSPISDFRVDFLFPLFNQANFFKNWDTDFPEAIGDIERSRLRNSSITIAYTQHLDIIRDEVFEASELANELAPPRRDRFGGPLLNWNYSNRNLFGRFFAHLQIIPGLDSVRLSTPTNEELVYSPQSNGGWQIGYTLHFGNDRSRLSNGKEFNQLRLRSRIGLFASAGLEQRYYGSSTSFNARLNRFSLLGQAGLRYGNRSFTVYGGVGISNPIIEDFIASDTQTDAFDFPDQELNYLFFGIAYRNAITARLRIQKLPSIKIESPPGDQQFSILIGFGI